MSENKKKSGHTIAIHDQNIITNKYLLRIGIYIGESIATTTTEYSVNCRDESCESAGTIAHVGVL